MDLSGVERVGDELTAEQGAADQVLRVRFSVCDCVTPRRERCQSPPRGAGGCWWCAPASCGVQGPGSGRVLLIGLVNRLFTQEASCERVCVRAVGVGGFIKRGHVRR